MPRIAQLFFKTAVIFLIVGIAAGLQMAISGNHNVIAAHAHINLIGWVTSALFGTYYALNPAKAQKRAANAHYWIYTVGAAVLSVALYFVLLGYTGLEPVAAVSSLVVAAGVLVFAAVVFTGEGATAAVPQGSPLR